MYTMCSAMSADHTKNPDGYSANAASNPSPNPSFGCAHCYADDLDPATAAEHGRYELDTSLRDDSHFIVSIRRCKACGQKFISIFTEFVDWAHGEDDQYRTLMPLTDREAEDLVDGVRALFKIGDLGATRRYLQSDWPRARPKTVRWARGAFEVREGD